MKTYTIIDDNYQEDKVYRRIRRAARAVIINKNDIFVEETANPKIIMLAGGGVEESEDDFSCIVRECREECGVLVKPLEKLFEIKEYYKDTVFYSIYVRCEIVQNCKSDMTANEKRLGLTSGWQDIDKILKDIEFLKDTYPKGSELEGMHKRECIAVEHIKKYCL